MQRMTRLDGLRGVLAIYVMLGHAMPFTVLPAWVQGPVHHGEAAVDVFFALSGLVVVQSLERFEYRAGPFLRARARRLLPVYFVVLAFAVGLIFAGSPVPEMPWVKTGSAAAEFWALGAPVFFSWHLLAHLTLTHGLIPQGVLPWAYITLLGPAWSLSTEWQFYVAAVVPRVRNLTVLAFLLLGCGVFYHAAAPFLPAYWQFSRAFLPDAAPYFALGVASAVWLRGGRIWPLGVVLAGTCALGLFSGEPSKALIPLGWMLALLAQRHRRLGRLLDTRIAQYLGAISYPLYLLNEPVQRACAMLVAPLAHGDAGLFTVVWLPLALAMPVAAAMALHHTIEMPMLYGPRRLRAPPLRNAGS
jgi:peptidoglycan/LPS O-acetylase OafA/YrhL